MHEPQKARDKPRLGTTVGTKKPSDYNVLDDFVPLSRLSRAFSAPLSHARKRATPLIRLSPAGRRATEFSYVFPPVDPGTTGQVRSLTTLNKCVYNMKGRYSARFALSARPPISSRSRKSSIGTDWDTGTNAGPPLSDRSAAPNCVTVRLVRRFR